MDLITNATSLLSSTPHSKYIWQGPPDRCNSTLAFWNAVEAMFVATYYFLTPIYALFALSGNSICLYVCCKESKKEGAYVYQIFCQVIELWQSISMSFHYTLCGFYGVFGMERTGAAADYFRSSYVLMWFWAYYTSPMMQACWTTSLLLSVCAVTDRVFALSIPFKYKNWNHKRIQTIGCILCVVTGFGSSIYDCFRPLIVVDDRGLYIIQLDLEYMGSTFVIFSNQFRNNLRIIGIIVLVTANIALLHLFRTKVLKKGTAIDDKKKAERKESEKILLILSVYQSISNTFETAASVTYYFMLYMPGFTTCLMYLMWPVMDFTVAAATGFDFYVLILVSKKFRQTAIGHVFRRRAVQDSYVGGNMSVSHTRVSEAKHGKTATVTPAV